MSKDLLHDSDDCRGVVAVQSVSPVQQPFIPSNSGRGRADAGDCCPVCLGAYDAPLPTTTTECDHRTHGGCLAQRKITHAQSVCPVCRNTSTGATVDDASPPAPAEGGGGQSLSSDGLRSGLLRAAEASCNADQADALLASCLPLDNDTLVLCTEIVSKLLDKAMIRVSIMSQREYDKLHSFISVFVKHGAVSRSWEDEDLPRLFQAWKAYERGAVTNASGDPGVHIKSSAMQRALKKAALSKDFDRTVRLLDCVGSNEQLQKVVSEFVDALLQERLVSRDRYDCEEYRNFKTYLDLFLCRGFCDQGTQSKAMQLYILMSDYKRAALAKEEFGTGVISGDTLRLSLDRAALEMDFEETRTLLEFALPDASVQEIASNVLQNVLLCARSRFQLLSCMDLVKLGWLVDVFFQLGILGQTEADDMLDIFVLCEDYHGAMRLKKIYGAEPKATTWEAGMHKAASNRDYVLAATLLDLATSQTLRNIASHILAAQLQNSLLQVREFGMEPRESIRLWRFVHTFFNVGVVDANLVGLTANIYEKVNDQTRVACLRSGYARYFNDAVAEPQEQKSSLTLQVDALNPPQTTGQICQNSGLESCNGTGAPATR